MHFISGQSSSARVPPFLPTRGARAHSPAALARGAARELIHQFPPHASRVRSPAPHAHPVTGNPCVQTLLVTSLAKQACRGRHYTHTPPPRMNHKGTNIGERLRSGFDAACSSTYALKSGP